MRNEMGNRPQTLYGIEDSPVGLAAWIIDHDIWTYKQIARVFDGEQLGFTRDDIVDNITLYWLTGHGRFVSPALLGEQGRLLRPQGGQGADRRKCVPGGNLARSRRSGRRRPIRSCSTIRSTPRVRTSRRGSSRRRWSTTLEPASGHCVTRQVKEGPVGRLKLRANGIEADQPARRILFRRRVRDRRQPSWCSRSGSPTASHLPATALRWKSSRRCSSHHEPQTSFRLIRVVTLSVQIGAEPSRICPSTAHGPARMHHLVHHTLPKDLVLPRDLRGVDPARVRKTVARVGMLRHRAADAVPADHPGPAKTEPRGG